jgi:hypothetical protein
MDFGQAGNGAYQGNSTYFFVKSIIPAQFFALGRAKKPGQETASEARVVFRGPTARRDKNRMS